MLIVIYSWGLTTIKLAEYISPQNEGEFKSCNFSLPPIQ